MLLHKFDLVNQTIAETQYEILSYYGLLNYQIYLNIGSIKRRCLPLLNVSIDVAHYCCLFYMYVGTTSESTAWHEMEFPATLFQRLAACKPRAKTGLVFSASIVYGQRRNMHLPTRHRGVG
jgi:hypothetical protein